MIETASDFILFTTFLAFIAKRLLTYMHVLQQEDYDNGRLFHWMGANKAFDKRLTFSLLVLGGAWFFLPQFFSNFLVFISVVTATYLEKDPRKNAKKKLVATPRAKRLFFPAYGFIALIAALYLLFPQPWLWVFLVQAIPFFLAFVNSLVKPMEEIVNKIYWNEAYLKVRELEPKIIGITGSFGKTSVKHILGHILKTAGGPTLITPGSVNTSMGISRIIREQLEEGHKYFVVEMGAYGPGSIAGLCDLTPPSLGIITSIGHAHYERFKSLEVVAHAKFELAASVMEREGKVVIHERTLRFPYPRQMKWENPKNFIVCGDPPEVNPHKQTDISYITKDDMVIQKIEQKAGGQEINLTWGGRVYILEVPLFGLHHAHNAVLAFAAALELGLNVDSIQAALRSTPQIQHRLEIKKQPDNIVIIDDAYNSNPLGFRSALDLMAKMTCEGRRILITPGMIELGLAHDEAHEKIGQYAAQTCDIVIVVTPSRIPSFIKGFKANGGDSKILMEFDGFEEASKWVEANKEPGDIILIENDLPDMYECVPKM